MLKVITDEKEWRSIIEGMPFYEFYHTIDYHLVTCKENEKPMLLYFEQGIAAIAIPFLKRPIPNSEYFDLTSVYGYAGPLSRGLDNGFDESSFQEQFVNLLKNERIISVFSRLNPYLPDQALILGNMGALINLGRVVNIDLTIPLTEQEKRISKTTRRYLRNSRRECYTEISNNRKDAILFKELYYETMNRVKADPFYYFDEGYFVRLLESTDFQTELILAKLYDTDTVISGAMMVKTNNMVQYHLSGTRTEYLKYTPLRLLIDDTRIRATQQGYTHFNLGGGHGSNEDSLFFFKSTFSKDFRQFAVWKFIIDQELYDQLVSQNTNLNKIEDLDTNIYFPLYRFK